MTYVTHKLEITMGNTLKIVFLSLLFTLGCKTQNTKLTKEATNLSLFLIHFSAFLIHCL